MFEIPPSVQKLSQAAKSPIYMVGGYVRNMLAGLGKTTDIDLAGPVVPQMLGIEKYGYKVKIVNHALGTAAITHNDSYFEYTPFRTEKYNKGGGHKPYRILFTHDVRLDAMRRDFTCNSVYVCGANGQIIDPLGGTADIERKIMRAANPDKIFASDGLRVLRLIRLAAELNFKIDGATAKAAKKNAANLIDISQERKRDELDAILAADLKYGHKFAHYRALKLLGQLGVWQYLLPPINEMVGLRQPPAHHMYDVYEHTMQCVKYAPPMVRLAALLHDIAKPYTHKLSGTFIGHEKNGEIMTGFLLGQSGLRYDKRTIAEVARLVRLHMYDFDNNTSESKVRIFVARNLDIIPKLICLAKADRLATGMADDSIEYTHRFEPIYRQILDDDVPVKLSHLMADGYDAIKCGLGGEHIRLALEECLNECILNPRLNNTDWLHNRLKKYAQRIAKQSTK